MNISVVFQKRFLIYALLLHLGVGLSFVIFNGSVDDDKENEVKRIVVVDISTSAKESSVMAETFSEEEINKELKSIESMSHDFKNDNRLNEANLKEETKELQSLKSQSKKVKRELIKEKKKLQLEKHKIEKDKIEAKKERDSLYKEKKKLEKEIQKIKDDAKKKVIKMNNKKVAEKKKKALKEDWLNSSEGKSLFVEYSSSLMNKIRGRWIRPIDARAGWNCKLNILQDKNGRIKRIKKNSCSPNNEKFYQSVYNAVMQSSPLPIPKNKALFDEKITFTFSVE